MFCEVAAQEVGKGECKQKYRDDFRNMSLTRVQMLQSQAATFGPDASSNSDRTLYLTAPQWQLPL